MKPPILLALGAAVLGAAEPPTRIRVDYTAPEGCPDARAFSALVLERSPLIAAARPGELARLFDVRIDRAADGYLGRVTLTDESGARRQREVPGATCGDVASALSLVVALAVDPDLPLGASPASSPTPAPLTSAPAQDTSPGRPHAPDPVTASAAPSGPPAALPARYLTRWGGALGAVWGVAPGARPAPALWLDTEREGGLALRLALTGTLSSEITAEAGVARAYWLALRADACPLGMPLGATRWLACAYVQAGVLHLARVDAAEQATRGWVAPGVLLRGVWQLQGLRLELAGGPGFPLLRQRYLLTSPEGREEVFRVPGITGFAELGIGTTW